MRSLYQGSALETGRENAVLRSSGISIYRGAASQRSVTSQDLLASLRTMFQKYRKTMWFRVTYLLLLGVLVAQLYLLTASALACLVLLLIPVSVFVVPYWLGERKLKRFGANALLVFAIAILLAAAMSTQALLSQRDAIPLRSFPEFQPSTMVLTNGTVNPYQAPPPGPFTFRVKLTTTTNATPANFSVFLNLTIVTGLSGFERPLNAMAYSPGNDSATNTRNGTWYETRLNLTDTIYGYGFSVRDEDGNWTLAGPDFGPLTASGWTYFGFFVYFTALSGVILVAFLFYYAILFLWWYTMRARQGRAALAAGSTEIHKPSAAKAATTAESSPKAGKAAAFTCTNCGADVGEADEKCPKCGASFED